MVPAFEYTVRKYVKTMMMKFAKSEIRRPIARLGAAFFFLLVCFGSLAQMPAAQAQTAAAPGSLQNGVIDANAKLHVTVANEAQLTGDYTVDAQGNITMLYINQVHVQGLTPAQAAAAIRGTTASGGKAATGLTQFYVRPQVIVTIADSGGITVDVTGLVSAPRHYVVPTNAHLDDVLQQAVPALNADLSKVDITRGDTKDKQTVDYHAYLDTKDNAGNPALHDGDIINISSREAQPIYVTVLGTGRQARTVPGSGRNHGLQRPASRRAVPPLPPM